MKAALKVIFTRLERFFLRNNKAFVLRNTLSSEGSNEDEEAHEEYHETPLLKALIKETFVARKRTQTRERLEQDDIQDDSS